MKRGRLLTGERSPNSVLKEWQALDCKSSSGSSAELAALHGCSRQNVADIRAGRTWRHLG